jgi:hypothetical protein
MIDKCSFGSMIINGRTYTSDLKIMPDGSIIDNWRRASGHKLTLADIEDIVAQHPEIIIAGTGIYGRMKSTADLHDHLAKEGIRLVLAWTKKAAVAFNTARGERKKVAACFHVTC